MVRILSLVKVSLTHRASFFGNAFLDYQHVSTNIRNLLMRIHDLLVHIRNFLLDICDLQMHIRDLQVAVRDRYIGINRKPSLKGHR